MDITNLPSLPLDARRALPRESGVYFVLNGYGDVLYIGTAVDISQRWLNHHLIDTLSEIADVRIAWTPTDPLRSRKDVERELIVEFSPPLNVAGLPARGAHPNTVTVNVRLPDDVHREIAAMAEADDRSLNGEIVHAVRQFIEARRRMGDTRLLRCAEPPAPYETGPAAP